ncbi:hypothetical protein Taro_035196, partial [Colocasia esculenta]|nr:hypothetical protein [Colocasia esculenta]
MDSRAKGKTVVRTAASSRFQSSRSWSWTPRSFGVFPSAGQLVLLLTASLFVAPKPPREVRHGTVKLPNSSRVRVRRSRWGSCRCSRSQQWDSPFLQLYFTLGHFEISRSMGGDCENQVLGWDRGLGSLDRYSASLF